MRLLFGIQKWLKIGLKTTEKPSYMIAVKCCIASDIYLILPFSGRKMHVNFALNRAMQNSLL
jgi:hypothetical protein